jgi:hypothetical protein
MICRPIRVLPIAILVMAMGCKKTASLSPAEIEQVKFDVNKMLYAYHDAINKGGLTAEFDYLDNSIDFFWVPPGYKQALDYDSVETILNQNALTLDKVNFKWENLSIIPLKIDLASFHGIVFGQMLDTAGINSEIRIIESGLIIKRKSGWKILSGQSAVIP